MADRRAARRRDVDPNIFALALPPGMLARAAAEQAAAEDAARQGDLFAEPDAEAKGGI